ncbi:MAG: CBS domain-containing protein [Candidatus Thorarchaeota archaeon]
MVRILTEHFMTPDIVAVDEDTPVTEAAKLMAVEDIGSLLVMRNDVLVGILTMRDVISAQLLSDQTFHSLVVRDIMSSPLVSVTPDADLWEVVKLMDNTGKHHIPVVSGSAAIGIVTASDIIRALATIRLVEEGSCD